MNTNVIRTAIGMGMQVLLALTFLHAPCHAQLDNLFEIGATQSDAYGFSHYPASPAFAAGQVFTEYLQATNDTHNQFQLLSEDTDPFIGMTHRRHQQWHKGVPVEGGEVTEHLRNGVLVFINGKVADGIAEPAIPSLSEEAALAFALAPYPGHLFAWMDSSWEAEAAQNGGSYFPQGSLIWTQPAFNDPSRSMDGGDFRLAWRFELFSLAPSFHKACYIDAKSGALIREDDLYRHNGDAVVWIDGTLQQLRFIDTDWGGLLTRHYLRANDFGRNIHTKRDAGNWSTSRNYKDADDLWLDSTDWVGTTAHYFACESWDYFSAPPFLRNGYDGLGTELRVVAEYYDPGDSTISVRYRFDENVNLAYFDFGVGYEYWKAIDVVGHEYTHAILHTRNLLGWEARSLEESFCDIFGEMIEARSENTIPDWIQAGQPAGLATRSMYSPKTMGVHYDSTCTLQIGQPDTYFGEFWAPSAACGSDPHINAGVQNKWFYLLAQGGTGTNDYGQNYAVNPIGRLDASLIVYFSMTTTLSGAVTHFQARNAAITAAGLLFGQCSHQQEQVENAWHAVGVGPRSTCPGTGNEPEAAAPPRAFVSPNPSTGIFDLHLIGLRRCIVEVRDAQGRRCLSVPASGVSKLEIDISAFPAGLYHATIFTQGSVQTLKLAKQ